MEGREREELEGGEEGRRGERGEKKGGAEKARKRTGEREEGVGRLRSTMGEGTRPQSKRAPQTSERKKR